MSREARALAALDDLEGVPRILTTDAMHLRRTFIAGEVMHVASPCGCELLQGSGKIVAAHAS